MLSMVRVAAMATLLSLAAASVFAASPTPKSSHGALVIVFKDGHRQSFNLADIDRVEFPAPAVSTSASTAGGALLPSRAHYLGKWEVGDGSGSNFYITLEETGDAWRSLGHKHGHWEYVDGEAQINWDDGVHDAIRKVGSNYQKSAYGSGKSFTDTPDNVTNARNTMPHPI